MFDDLGTVDWGGLHHAYGPAAEVPELIRGLASGDPQVAKRAYDRLDGTVIHQGTTYSATPPVVPYLVALLADEAGHQRGPIAWLIGEMAAYNNPRTRYLGKVRAAVNLEVDRLLPLLGDADPRVRGGVAFVLSQCPKRKRDSVPALRARFDGEEDPQVRAVVLAAGQWLDARTDMVTVALGEDQPAPVRAAAAIVLARSELAWTPEATAAVRAGWADGMSLEESWWWGWGKTTLRELVEATGRRGPECAAVVAMLLESASESVREETTRAAVWVTRVERRTRSALVPVLIEALADESPTVRANTAWALREAGAAARPAADALDRLAATDRGQAAGEAVAALVEMGDARWREWLPARLAAAEPVVDAVELLAAARVPFDATLCDAVSARLDAIARVGPTSRDNACIRLLASWGPAAQPALPHLLALEGEAYQRDVLAALTAMGPAATDALGRLRTKVGSADTVPVLSKWGPFRVSHVAERVALWRIAGDPEPALDGARAALGYLLDPPNGVNLDNLPYLDAVTLIDGLDEAGRVLLPELRDVLSARQHYLGLARLWWRWGGDAAQVVPTVRYVLESLSAALKRRHRPYPIGAAVELAVDVGEPTLVPLLRPLLADPGSGRVAAALAVWRLTRDPEGLVDPLVKEVTGRPPGARWADAFDVLAEMGPSARSALPALREVAEHRWSPFVDFLDSEIHRGLGHQDDLFLAAARRAIESLAT